MTTFLPPIDQTSSPVQNKVNRSTQKDCRARLDQFLAFMNDASTAASSSSFNFAGCNDMVVAAQRAASILQQLENNPFDIAGDPSSGENAALEAITAEIRPMEGRDGPAVVPLLPSLEVSEPGQVLLASTGQAVVAMSGSNDNAHVALDSNLESDSGSSTLHCDEDVVGYTPDRETKRARTG